MVNAAILQLVIVSVWMVAGARDVSSGSEGHGSETSNGDSQSPPSVLFKDNTTQESTGTVKTNSTLQTQDIPTQPGSASSTSVSSVLDTAPTSAIIGTAVTTIVPPSSTLLSKIEKLSTSEIQPTQSYSTPASTFQTSQIVSTVQLSHTNHVFDSSLTLKASTTYDSIVFTEHQETASLFLNTGSESWTALPEAGSTLVQSSDTSLPWQQSSDLKDLSSEPVVQDRSTQEDRPTATVYAQTTTTSFLKPEPLITASPSSSMPATSTSEAVPYKPLPSSSDEVKGESSRDLSQGAKVAIGIIATLCILGLVIAGVAVYRRYNFTHRSLKCFLTSGVRYKTYNNATYKDDEVVGDVGIVSELT